MPLFTLILTLLCQDSFTLEYGTEKTKPEPVEVTGGLEISVEGKGAVVDYVRMSHPIFSLQKVKYRMEGEYKCTGKNRHKIAGFRASVEGMYDDEEYERDYSILNPPEKLTTDMFELIIWGTSMGPHTFTRYDNGSLLNDDKNQDAYGEVLTLYSLGTIRVPLVPVTVGESWTSRWTTTRKQKDNGGQFRLVQKATLLKVETRNGREIAFIDAKMTGTLHAPKEKKNPGEEKWTKTEGWMKLELEIETGRVLRSKGDGKVHNYYKGTDPGTGKESKLDLIFRSWGDYRGKNAERRSPSREKDY